jgi:hypothetical protein
LDKFGTQGSFTAADFANFRRNLESAMQSKPSLAQVPLVDVKLVDQRGEIAMKEVDRAAAAIAALREFLDEYGQKLTNGTRR